jgi:hypothetical protein
MSKTKTFERIEALPEGVKQYLHQEFAAKTDFEEVARQLQEAGYFTDVAAQSVVMLLARYQRTFTETPEEPGVAQEPGREFDPVHELRALASKQKERVERALEKESQMGVPIDSNNKAIAEYTSTLVALQKAQSEQQKMSPKPLSARIKEALELAEVLNNPNR